MVILKHNIVDTPTDRKKVEKMILESVNDRIRPQTKTQTQTDKLLELAPLPEELTLQQTKFNEYKKLYRIKDKFNINKNKFDSLSTNDKNQIKIDLEKASIVYNKTIKDLEIKLDGSKGFGENQVQYRSALKSQINILKRQLGDLKRFQRDLFPQPTALNPRAVKK